MSIRTKLTAMAAAPLAIILIISVINVISQARTVSEMNNLETLSQLSVKISSLVHETQKERGRTAGFLGSKGQKFRSELTAQRKLADEKAKELHAFLETFDTSHHNPEIQTQFTEAMSKLSELQSWRQKIDSLSVPAPAAIGYYTQMNAAMLNTIGSVVHESQQAEISKLVSAYSLFLKGKERAGIERAVLSNTFAQDTFGPGMFSKFIALVTEQNTYTDEFQKLATNDSRHAYDKAMGDPSIKQVQAMRDIASEKSDTGGFGVDANQWFATITKKINQLKSVEDALSQELSNRTSEIRASASSAMWNLLLIVTVVIVSMSVVTWWSIRSITVPMNDLVGKMDLIQTSNDLTQRSNINRNDEIGKMAASFDTMVGTLESIISQVRTSSEQVAAAATEVSSNSEQLQQGLSGQVSRVSEMRQAVMEMAQDSQAMASSSTHANESVAQSADVAREGGEIVNQTVTGMHSIQEAVDAVATMINTLGERSEEIGQVIEVINDIADQTNLLALNAAIEAARAGEHGRGFAVVADEVRKLADRTTKATEEIANSIRTIQSETGSAVTRMEEGTTQVNQGVELANRATASLEQIVSASSSLSTQVSSIAEGAERQNQSSEQVREHIEAIESFSSQANDGSREASQAATDLSRRAEELSELVSRFKTTS